MDDAAAKKKRGEIVKYANELNDLRLKDFETADLNIFCLICARVKDQGSEEIVLSYRDIRKITGYKARNNDRMFQIIDRMAYNFTKCNGHYMVGRKSVYFNPFQEFVNDPDAATLTVSISPKYTHLFTNVAKEFTIFELEEFISLSGKYSKGLYRVLKQWRTLGITRLYSIDEIRNSLDTPDYETRYISSFVIKPAVEEISKKGLFKELRCETVRGPGRGRPVKGYIFHFQKEAGRIPAEDSRKTIETGKAKKNAFLNFSQRQDYDMEALEKQLEEI